MIPLKHELESGVGTITVVIRGGREPADAAPRPVRQRAPDESLSVSQIVDAVHIARLWTLSTGCDECQQAMSGPQLRRRGAIGGPRARGAVRSALVEAGVALARSGGPDTVVLREVTRMVAVVPEHHLRHFADRDALLASASSTDSHHRSSPARRSALAGSPGRSPSSTTTTRRNHSTLRDRRPTARPLPFAQATQLTASGDNEA